MKREDESSDFDTSIGSSAEESLPIGKQETQAIRAVRLVSIFGLFCAIPLAVGVFYYTKNAEEREFESQFEESARKVLQSIGLTLEHSFGALDNLAVAVVASVHALNQTFPNFRVEDFSVRAAKTLSLSRAKVLVLCPVVTSETYDAWTNWTAKEGINWVEEALSVQKTDENFHGPIVEEYSTLDVIYSSSSADLRLDEEGQTYLPSWQAYPIVPYWAPYNFDYISAFSYTTAHTEMLESGKITITNPYLNPDPNDPEELDVAQQNAAWLKERLHPDEEPLEPASDMYFPIFDNVESVRTDPSEHPPVATFAVTFYWRDMIRDILPDSDKGILVVVENPCSATFTYRLDGSDTTLLGRGDRHESQYDQMELYSLITDLSFFRIRDSTYTGPDMLDDHCPISFKIYPSKDTEAEYRTSNPLIFSGVTVLICVVATFLFLLYDRFQERRQRLVMENAQQTNAVVSSLFPAAIRAKLFDRYQGERNETLHRVKGGDNKGKKDSAPIAELYTDTTVMFADIAGFTAWASTREASHVFALLESIYTEFDALARKSKIFKVETVGDSYVAVCGLPEPRKDHHVVMARFAAECRNKMREISQDLASSLGPGTETLRMRYGLNSGPITGGVLRGDRSRFQLFGDTANTAARMESTGFPDRIQASRKTADLLIESGKGEWVTQRQEVVNVKGKGTMTTYWIEPEVAKAQPGLSLSDVGSTIGDNHLKYLIDFNVEVLENLLKDVVAYTLATNSASQLRKKSLQNSQDNGFDQTTPRSEIVEVISIPKLETSSKASHGKNTEVVLSPVVRDQLRTFVVLLANMHNNDNPFHNFDHATHVAMSVRKLLSRILKPLQQKKGNAKINNILRSTYALTSDPMIQFAVYFSALIHDADHPGVSNGTLSKEGDDMAISFDHKSCAEQNSIVLAWSLFMSSQFKELRACIFVDDESLNRFRQLVINAVMATDIFDAELKSFRERRWGKAFPSEETSTLSLSTAEMEGDFRATIVIEHIIQASDVVHTMQHWTVYQKWNQRLFSEMRLAYKAGRTEKDPAEGWYGGELWFFDNYIIPLAQKLKECGVFGVSCDEVLDYAKDNRMEWEQKGKEIVAQWVEEEPEDSATCDSSASLN